MLVTNCFVLSLALLCTSILYVFYNLLNLLDSFIELNIEN